MSTPLPRKPCDLHSSWLVRYKSKTAGDATRETGATMRIRTLVAALGVGQRLHVAHFTTLLVSLQPLAARRSQLPKTTGTVAKPLREPTHSKDSTQAERPAKNRCSQRLDG